MRVIHARPSPALAPFVERLTMVETDGAVGAGVDLRGVRKDGSEFFAEISLGPVETGQGMLVTAIRDVTERRKVEAKFRASEAAPDAAVIVDQRRCIVLVNSQTERLFGYSRDELLGESMEKLVPERFRGAHPAHRADYVAAPRVRSMGSGLELRPAQPHWLAVHGHSFW